MPRETMLRRMCEAAAEDIANQVQRATIRGDFGLGAIALEPILRAALVAARNFTFNEASGDINVYSPAQMWRFGIDAILAENADGEANAR